MILKSLGIKEGGIVILFLFSVLPSHATIGINCPSNSTLTYSNQEELDASFIDFIKSIRTTAGSCPITFSTDLSTFTAPQFTGGCTTIVFEATDCDGTESCTAVFTAVGPSLPSAIPICPGDMTLPSCTSNTEAMASFRSWIKGFSYTGSCDVITTDLSTYSPPGCGGTTEVLYEITTMGLTIGCTATFAIPAEIAGPDPSISAVPTIGEWGIICLFLIFAIIGIVELKGMTSHSSSKIPSKRIK